MDLSEISADAGARHPWELARFRFLADVLLRNQGLADARTILDAGAGDAWFSLSLLAECHADAKVICWDQAYNQDSERQLGVSGMSRITLQSTTPKQQVDLVLALDVLEHVEDDDQFLTRLVNENLKSGGLALLSVPAWQILFTQHDKRLRHHRRYSPTEFFKLIEQSGLEVVQAGSAFHSLLLPRAIARTRESLVGSASGSSNSPLAWTAGKLTTELVYRALRVDNWFSRIAAQTNIPLPGLTLWSLCRKP